MPDKESLGGRHVVHAGAVQQRLPFLYTRLGHVALRKGCCKTVESDNDNQKTGHGPASEKTFLRTTAVMMHRRSCSYRFV